MICLQVRNHPLLQVSSPCFVLCIYFLLHGLPLQLAAHDKAHSALHQAVFVRPLALRVTQFWLAALQAVAFIHLPFVGLGNDAIDVRKGDMRLLG